MSIRESFISAMRFYLTLVFVFSYFGLNAQIVSVDGEVRTVTSDSSTFSTLQYLPGVHMSMRSESLISIDPLEVLSLVEIANDSHVIIFKAGGHFFSVSGRFRTAFKNGDRVEPNEVILKSEVGEILCFRLFDSEKLELNPLGVLFQLD